MSDTSDSAARREEREVPVIPGYQIEAVAGETTSTQSWEALQISLDRRVVLLTLKVELVGDPAKPHLSGSHPMSSHDSWPMARSPSSRSASTR